MLAFRVRVEPSEGVMRAELCFPEGRPNRLAPVEEGGADYLRWAVGPQGHPLEREGDLLVLPPADGPGCIQYAVDLSLAARTSSWVSTHGEDLLTSAGLWLWRPEPLLRGTRGTVRFEASAGLRVLTPWVVDGRERRLDPSAFKQHALVAFGWFPVRSVAVPGGQIVFARLGGARDPSGELVARWLGAAGRAVSTIYGRFPVPRVTAMLVPAPPGPDPVPFGMVHRGGGASVMLMLREGARPEPLVRDWVAVHELSHLALPLVRRGDAWLSEGLATYYQEVSRARAGLITPLQAWRHIDEGFDRGRRAGTGRTLREESAQMFRSHAYRRVYWAGTAFALEADTLLRSRHGTSLDAVVERAMESLGPESGPWSAEKVLRRMDQASNSRVLTTLARTYLERTDFPPTRPMLERLGLVRDSEGQLVVEERAPLAKLRQSIMAGPGTRKAVERTASRLGLVSAPDR